MASVGELMAPCDLPSKTVTPAYAGRKFEYLDHTADIQIHSFSLGGENLEEAFQEAAMGMFGYMTELQTVEGLQRQEITAQGHDLASLLFHFLDEWLFLFSAEPFFIPQKMKITQFDRVSFKIKAEGFGETFDVNKHPQGAEVKAITYSNMQIYDEPNRHEVYVIVDI